MTEPTARACALRAPKLPAAKLTLATVLDELGRWPATRADADKLLAAVRAKPRADIYPLVTVADANPAPAARPHKTLTRWLADKCALPYERIDPLKVDVPRLPM